jgi:hypothetical protein
MANLLSLKEVSNELNFSEEEIMELVRQKRIPYLYFPAKDEYLFPDTDVRQALSPRPKKEEASPFAEEKQNEPVVARRGRPKKI